MNQKKFQLVTDAFGQYYIRGYYLNKKENTLFNEQVFLKQFFKKKNCEYINLKVIYSVCFTIMK